MKTKDHKTFNRATSKTVKRAVWVLMALFAVSGLNKPSYAGDLVKVGTTAANFLQLRVGARAIAMGGSFVGLANDVSALYWNPAGITDLPGVQAFYQNSRLYAGLKHQSFGLSYALDGQNYLGFLVNYLDMGKMEQTTLESPEGTNQTFDAASMAIGLTFARQLTNRVSFGITAKYIQERIWLEYARGYAFDIATMYNIREKGIRIGMNLSNMGPDMGIGQAPHLKFYKRKPDDYPGSPQPEAQLSTKTFPLPLAFSMGVGIDWLGQTALRHSEENRITTAVSITDGYDSPFRMNLGLEYAWHEVLAFRAGYYLNYDTENYSLGFGLNIYKYARINLQIDYAWMNYGDLGSINAYGLQFKF